MVALYAVWYKFCRIHKFLRVSPAMAAGVADRLWSMEDVAEMVEAGLPKPGSAAHTKRRTEVERTPFEQIQRRFFFNMDRVDHLIKLFSLVQENEALQVSYKEDILRSAVVMLHASLEDLLRGLIKWKALQNPSIISDSLRFPGQAAHGKLVDHIGVKGLIIYKGKTVEDILEICINEHLKRRSFNDMGDVTNALNILGLKNTDFSANKGAIVATIDRRHKIVHESDRIEITAKSHGRPRPLDDYTLGGWHTIVRCGGHKWPTRTVR